MNSQMTRSFVLISAAVLLAAAANIPGAQSAENFYKGKTVTVLCPFGVGGGYGRTVTLISKHLSRFLPGNPNSVPQFMTGAGGIKMANYLYNVAPKDGTVVALLYDNLPTSQLLYATRGVKYKSEEFTALGSLSAGDRSVIAVMSDVPINSVQDATKVRVVMAAAGKGTTNYVVPAMLNNTLGTKFKIVLGYRDMNRTFLAMEQGEAQGTLVSWSIINQLRPEWIKQRKIKILFQVGNTRHRELKHVPLLTEVTDNPSHRQVFEFMSRASTMAKGMVAPPGIPAERAAELRRAVAAMAKDEDFIAAAAKSRILIEPLPWQHLDKTIKNTIKTDPKIVEMTKKIIGG